MNNIETSRLLVRTGATMSKLRTWVSTGLILRVNGNRHRLNRHDTFSETSLGIRTAFLLMGDKNDRQQLVNAFNAELGANDINLSALLENSSPSALIVRIGERYQLHYDLRKVRLFSIN